MEEEREKEVEEEIISKREETVSTEEYLKLKKSNNKKKVTIVVLIYALVALMVLGVTLYLTAKPNSPSNDNGNKETNQEEKYDNTFVYDENGSYGIAYAKGYATVEEEYYCENASECNETNADEIKEVVYFHVTNTESEDLKKAINEWNSEKSVDGLVFKLGNLEDNAISICTYADDFFNGSDEYKNSPEHYANIVSVSREDSNKITSSNESNPITLKLEKLKYSLSTTSDFSTCGTLITKVEVIK